MKNSGQIVLFQFPQTNLTQGKLRPALLIGRLPGPYDDWLICMVSSQLQHVVPAFDETIQPQDADFAASGFKVGERHPNWTTRRRRWRCACGFDRCNLSG